MTTDFNDCGGGARRTGAVFSRTAFARTLGVGVGLAWAVLMRAVLVRADFGTVDFGTVDFGVVDFAAETPAVAVARLTTVRAVDFRLLAVVFLVYGTK